MLKSERRLDLQLFGGEGAGGSGAGDGAGGDGGQAAGVEAADPGRQRLLDKGVPAAVLAKYSRSYQRPSAPAAQQADRGGEDPDDADVPESPAEETKSTKPSWEEISKDPDYQEGIQSMMRARLKADKGAAENLKALAPALEVLARNYKLDISKGVDYAALAKAVEDDNQYYEDKALDMGVDVETAKKADQDERTTARVQREHQDELQQQMYDQHMARLEQQAAKMKQMFPGFDLRTELRNPVFSRMTSPGVNLSLKDAYFAVHREELEAQSAQVVAQKTMEKAAAAIQSGSRRPVEAGTASQAPSVYNPKTYDQMTPEERKAFRDEIHRRGSVPLINRR